MKALLLTLLLFVSAIASSQQMPVYEQVANNNQGAFIRIFNTLPRYVSCYYRDDYNYFTFVIAPHTVTVWQPIYGTYVWECL